MEGCMSFFGQNGDVSGLNAPESQTEEEILTHEFQQKLLESPNPHEFIAQSAQTELKAHTRENG